MSDDTVILPVPIPRSLIPDLTVALSARMVDSADPVIAEIATRARAGEATTGAEKTALARRGSSATRGRPSSTIAASRRH